jgi:hypothetical protein
VGASWYLKRGNPTSMIGICQEGKALSRRASEERVYKFLATLRRVCWPLGPWFLLRIPDFHLLSQTGVQPMHSNLSRN